MVGIENLLFFSNSSSSPKSNFATPTKFTTVTLYVFSYLQQLLVTGVLNNWNSRKYFGILIKFICSNLCDRMTNANISSNYVSISLFNLQQQKIKLSKFVRWLIRCLTSLFEKKLVKKAPRHNSFIIKCFWNTQIGTFIQSIDLF